MPNAIFDRRVQLAAKVFSHLFKPDYPWEVVHPSHRFPAPCGPKVHTLRQIRDVWCYLIRINDVFVIHLEGHIPTVDETSGRVFADDHLDVQSDGKGWGGRPAANPNDVAEVDAVGRSAETAASARRWSGSWKLT